ncbi:MAG: PAC2 family protein [Thermoproteota archaeon]|nr:PAC2 family protein [Thermoproteota archaeon]
MVCTVKIKEHPSLNNPVLIEGLPGIGFVANITALHLIRELNTKLLAEIHSSFFRDFTITAENGALRSPVNELYYYKRKDGEPDLLILYGNTQALTMFGQYELCGHILDIAEELGCRSIITLGGLKREKEVASPKLYCAASDHETLQKAVNLGAETLRGEIFGAAGLLVGLGKLRGFKGFCLLAETSGFYPDASAAYMLSKAVCNLLNLKVDLSKLDKAAEKTHSILQSFGLTDRSIKEKREKKSEFRWFI